MAWNCLPGRGHSGLQASFRLVRFQKWGWSQQYVSFVCFFRLTTDLEECSTAGFIHSSTVAQLTLFWGTGLCIIRCVASLASPGLTPVATVAIRPSEVSQTLSSLPRTKSSENQCLSTLSRAFSFLFMTAPYSVLWMDHSSLKQQPMPGLLGCIQSHYYKTCCGECSHASISCFCVRGSGVASPWVNVYASSTYIVLMLPSWGRDCSSSPQQGVGMHVFL